MLPRPRSTADTSSNDAGECGDGDGSFFGRHGVVGIMTLARNEAGLEVESDELPSVGPIDKRGDEIERESIDLVPLETRRVSARGVEGLFDVPALSLEASCDGVGGDGRCCERSAAVMAAATAARFNGCTPASGLGLGLAACDLPGVKSVEDRSADGLRRATTGETSGDASGEVCGEHGADIIPDERSCWYSCCDVEAVVEVVAAPARPASVCDEPLADGGGPPRLVEMARLTAWIHAMMVSLASLATHHVRLLVSM